MITYFSWWYLDEPIYLFKSLKITTLRVFYSFSVPELISTLFAPWKKDILYKENPSLSESFQILIGNMISRLVGAIVRFITILTGLILTAFVFLVGLLFLIGWLVLPIIILYLLFNGIKNING